MQVEFIGCSSSSDTEPWHTAWPLSSTTARVDIRYLRLLVEHGVQEVKRPILDMQRQSENIVVCNVYVMHTLCIC